jgi:hypothetical protein
MSFSLLTPENIGSMLNTFITIDIAMLSIIFAVLAINSKHLLEVLKNNPNVDLNRFQGFILLSALSILGNLFIYVLNYIPQTTGSTSLDIFGITICVYLRSFMLGITTFFTLILVFLFVYYTSIIFEEIIKASQRS